MEITHPDSTTEALSYDDNGQLVKSEKSTGETTVYEWNDQGMLVKVILPNGEPVEYEYDGNQRLISRKSSDGVDNFVQSGWDIMTKTDDLGKRTYYTGSSAIEDQESVKYFHYNHRGDTVLVTDSEGNTLNHFSYEAYGAPTNSEGIPVNNLSIKDLPNLFVGASGIRYDTKTNLHYMRFRWFSPSQMRFINPDFVMSSNRYSYVNSNPITYVDIFGLWKIVYTATGHFIAIPTKEGDDSNYLVRAGYRNFVTISGKFSGQASEYKYKEFYNITNDLESNFPGITDLFEEQERLRREAIERGSGYPFNEMYNCWIFTFWAKKVQEYRNADNGFKKRDNFEGKYSVPGGPREELGGRGERNWNTFRNRLYNIINRQKRIGDVVIWRIGQDNSFGSYTHFAIHTGLDDIIIQKGGFIQPLEFANIGDLRAGQLSSFWSQAMLDLTLKEAKIREGRNDLDGNWLENLIKTTFTNGDLLYRACKD